MDHSDRPRLAALAAILAVTALVLAACGGASSSRSGAGTTSGASSRSSTTTAAGSGSGPFDRAKFEACLKSHGVTLPARRPGAGALGAGAPRGAPGSRGAGAPGTSGSQSSSTHRHRGLFGVGGAFADPKLRAALQACGAGRFRPGAPGHRFTLDHAAVLKFVACVRKRGYSLPAPNFSGKGSIFPPSIEHEARFQAAARSCSSLLAAPSTPGEGPGPPGGRTTPGA